MIRQSSGLLIKRLLWKSQLWGGGNYFGDETHVVENCGIHNGAHKCSHTPSHRPFPFVSTTCTERRAKTLFSFNRWTQAEHKGTRLRKILQKSRRSVAHDSRIPGSSPSSLNTSQASLSTKHERESRFNKENKEAKGKKSL